jgi:hypothetical protein
MYYQIANSALLPTYNTPSIIDRNVPAQLVLLPAQSVRHTEASAQARFPGHADVVPHVKPVPVHFPSKLVLPEQVAGAHAVPAATSEHMPREPFLLHVPQEALHAVSQQ